MCYFSYYYDFERNYDVLMSCQRVHAFCWTKINFHKNKTKSKIKNPHTISERRNLCFSSYKNCKLKIKLWWVGAREKKKRAFFVQFIFSEGNSFNIFVLSQYILYWIDFQDIHIFTYQRILLHILFCLFLKASKAFSVPWWG